MWRESSTYETSHKFVIWNICVFNALLALNMWHMSIEQVNLMSKLEYAGVMFHYYNIVCYGWGTLKNI
jgi:hypothetical protein